MKAISTQNISLIILLQFTIHEYICYYYIFLLSLCLELFMSLIWMVEILYNDVLLCSST